MITVLRRRGLLALRLVTSSLLAWACSGVAAARPRTTAAWAWCARRPGGASAGAGTSPPRASSSAWP